MKITIQNLQTKIPVDLRKVRKAVREVCARERLGRAVSSEITVCFITDTGIKRLNARYHGRDIPTDVLAFDLRRNEKEVIADIYISADTALRNAKLFSSVPAQEVLLYCIHGLLHIAGYKDKAVRDSKRMRKKENYYMRKIGYSWPS